MVPAWMLIAALALAALAATGWWLERHRAQTAVDRILADQTRLPPINRRRP